MFDFLLFLVPVSFLLMLHVCVSESAAYTGTHSPHTLLKMTDFSVMHLFFFFLLYCPSSSFPILFPPQPSPLPLGDGSCDGRRDGWCYFELWHVIPLLFINNWPAPSAGPIYRADFCFAKKHKLLKLCFFLHFIHPTQRESSVLLISAWNISAPGQM